MGGWIKLSVLHLIPSMSSSIPIFQGTNIKIGENVSFGHHVIIYDNVSIGNGTVIGDFCIIGEGPSGASTSIGQHCIIRSQSILYAGAQLGDFVQTGNRATIREDSFVDHHAVIGLGSELQGLCSVGAYTRIQSYVTVGQQAEIGKFVFIYPMCVLTNDPLPPSKAKEGVRVGDFSQIASGSILLGGADIGRFSLVGAASKVGGIFEDDSYIEGNPGRRMGKLSKMPFFNKEGKRHYPWPYHYSTNMPWDGMDFDEWALANDIRLF